MFSTAPKLPASTDFPLEREAIGEEEEKTGSVDRSLRVSRKLTGGAMLVLRESFSTSVVFWRLFSSGAIFVDLFRPKNKLGGAENIYDVNLSYLSLGTDFNAIKNALEMIVLWYAQLVSLR